MRVGLFICRALVLLTIECKPGVRANLGVSGGEAFAPCSAQALLQINAKQIFKEHQFEGYKIINLPYRPIFLSPTLSVV